VSYRDLDAILASISHSSEQKNGVAHTNRVHQLGRCLPQWHRVTPGAYMGLGGLIR
jgi:hypothetical protein